MIMTEAYLITAHRPPQPCHEHLLASFRDPLRLLVGSEREAQARPAAY